MAEVLFNKGKAFAKFLHLIGGIRVDRDDKNFGFISDSIEVLDNGGTLGIFPQGRLPVAGKPFPFTVSTAFIATHADAPIVPVFTDGNYGIKKRAHVVIGEAFYLNDYIKEGLSEDEQLKHLTEVLEEKVYELKNEIAKRKK
jgi:1-acyl-sn-glycerol-3-phosphate acyltransferase